jgi:ribosomal protein S18 acetylase RimI-like enzyme
VRTLGVREEMRGRGLGKALLHQSFTDFYRRGVPKVGLAVDSQNPTGATRLYQKVGMQIAEQYSELSKQF